MVLYLFPSYLSLVVISIRSGAVIQKQDLTFRENFIQLHISFVTKQVRSFPVFIELTFCVGLLI